ncbi:O-sialoglycoprotein endopeptidase [Polycladomyces abyssicola]|uniref:N(6)-L-threonylcarbamoyladenine synthase n=1 Tax=Polycladomyces abyssicola TaxID=1125966 RepID=A0A8D5UG56_9BACL|nr:O-sialoglycoprotein endopeptidase [Polycladomyces abyssicola]BCU81593.1 O-sialoglycoprotein endopeptidase [Polycladomyces abyssicola]
MSTSRAVLGVDTSNYCTSMCLVDDEGNRLAEERQWLDVPQGERGLQQSRAVFQHVRRLPELFLRLPLDQVKVAAVAVSTAPRPQAGSYMPVFQVGTSWAQSLAHAWGVPLIETTHQEGHIAAGEATADRTWDADRFLAVHLSGGTTDLLNVSRRGAGYDIEMIGGSSDLHAGQLVDRIGVAMGLPFPSGRHVEELALRYDGREQVTIPSSVDGLTCSFSGPQTALLRLWEKRAASKEALSFAALRCVANTVEKLLQHAFDQGYPKKVLIVGGVAANSLIRERLRKRLEHPAVRARLIFADPRYSGDNAYGVARIGLRVLKG